MLSRSLPVRPSNGFTCPILVVILSRRKNQSRHLAEDAGHLVRDAPAKNCSIMVIKRGKTTMKEKAYAAGDSVEMMCSACDTEQNHNVVTATKQGKITKAACEVCNTESTFVRGEKTSVNVGNAKNASPYDRTRKYRKGQSMMHTTFGRGEVTAVIEPQKIDVLFGDRTRRMLHDQGK